MPERSRVIALTPAASAALDERRPLIVLESAVISHGLPAAIALQTAAAMTRDAEEEGALALTAAVLDGAITLGASLEQLRRLTSPGAAKIAARDLPTAVALKQTGGTTVSATIEVAAVAGAAVVATGGIGGVHLGAGRTWDVSADVAALAARPVAVVCSGAKVICDVPKTLEMLETAGVTVVGFGTDRFPYFYATDSGCPAPRRIDTPQQAADIMLAKRALGQHSGLLIAHPVPPAEALDRLRLTKAVDQARRDARAAGTAGVDVTPFLLARLAALTNGASVRTNVALLRANARVAARIAVAISGSRVPG